MDDLVSYITVNSEVRFGEPTRNAVADILQWMASGMSREEILDDYPMLQDNHIRAALSFAADRESFIKIIPAYANLTFA